MPDSLFPEKPDPRLPELHALLLERYGRPAPRAPWDPLTQLIYSMLTSRTKEAESQQVMRDLANRFPTWEDLRDAPVEDIERTIAIVTFPEIKAPRLKAALTGITARYGSLTLDFLARYRTEKIRSWLEQFEGIGNQVSAAVVNFSTLRRRALCVDAHHLRVTQRLALTPRADAAVTEERLMRLAPPEWTAEILDEHHSLVKIHGQTLCTFSNPQCPRCPLLPRCPFGTRAVATTSLATTTFGQP